MNTTHTITKTYFFEFETDVDANRFAALAAMVINPSDITSVDGRVTLDYVKKEDLELIKTIS